MAHYRYKQTTPKEAQPVKTKDGHEQGPVLYKQVAYTESAAKTTQDIKEARVQMHTKDTKLHKQTGIN